MNSILTIVKIFAACDQDAEWQWHAERVRSEHCLGRAGLCQICLACANSRGTQFQFLRDFALDDL